MTTNVGTSETSEQAMLRFKFIRQHIDNEMTKLASTTFRYRSYEFPPKGLKIRLETSFGDMLVKFHAASEMTLESGKALQEAYDLHTLNVDKAEWSFQHDADPEGADMPWGERTVTNDFESPYTVKSFVAFVTPTTFGVVGFDKYGDTGWALELTNHPDETGCRSDWQNKLPAVPIGTPGAKTVEEMMEFANRNGLELIDEWHLPEARFTPAYEVVDIKPARPIERAEVATTIAAAAPRI
jgi:hypothetical protein